MRLAHIPPHAISGQAIVLAGANFLRLGPAQNINQMTGPKIFARTHEGGKRLLRQDRTVF